MTRQSPEIDKKERLQRVRIGATGLAAVILVVMGAGALTRSASDEAPVDRQDDVETPSGLPDMGAPANNSSVAKPQEPLAELGVAPSPETGNDDAANAGQGKHP